MSTRFKLWIGVCAVIAAIAVASLARATKTGNAGFSERIVGRASSYCCNTKFLPVKVESFALWLSIKIQDINDVIVRRLERSGIGITACDKIPVSQVTDGPPAHASGNIPTPVLERTEGFTQGAPQREQKSGLKRLLHLAIASLKILVRICLKKSRHAV